MLGFVGREWLRNETFPPERLKDLGPFQPYITDRLRYSHGSLRGFFVVVVLGRLEPAI